MPDPIIGHSQFTDDGWRPMFEQHDGPQYVLDDDAERLYGIWLIPKDEADQPLIVDSYSVHAVESASLVDHFLHLGTIACTAAIQDRTRRQLLRSDRPR